MIQSTWVRDCAPPHRGHLSTLSACQVQTSPIYCNDAIALFAHFSPTMGAEAFNHTCFVSKPHHSSTLHHSIPISAPKQTRTQAEKYGIQSFKTTEPLTPTPF
jgi:hypothetical protein